MSAHDDSLNVRCNKESKRKFIEKCRDMGRDHPDMIRELVDAFIDGRVKIQPTNEQQKLSEEIYQP